MVCSHGVVSCSSALLSVLLLVLIVTMTTGQVLNNEEPCMTKGGFCVESDACSEDQRVNETNLCPEQEQYGAVCCNRGQILRNEKPCLSEGGICVESNSCTEENRVKKPELCPEQEQYGAVCCNRVPANVDCQQHGGRCGQEEECRNVQDFGQLDCNDGSRCCLLIF